MKESPIQIPVTVLMPAYNEEKSIGTTISRIKGLYPNVEVLAVDDGTTDNTLKVAMEVVADFLLPCSNNIGNETAIKTGLSL